MRAPALLALPFEHWIPSAPLLAVAAAVAGVYLMMSVRASHWQPLRTAAFIAGIAIVQVALESGLGSYDERLLSAHMLQHLLLIELGPALLLYGRPLHLALKTLPARERRTLGRALVRSRRVFTPAVCASAFSVIVIGVHTPWFFDASVRHQPLHEFEHTLFLIAGLLMWWPLLGDPEPRRRLGTIGQLLYLTAAMLPMALIGAFLNRDRTLFYSVYASPTRALHLAPIFDQQRAGAIMLVAGTVTMSVLGMAVLISGMVAAERHQRARELHGAAG